MTGLKGYGQAHVGSGTTRDSPVTVETGLRGTGQNVAFATAGGIATFGRTPGRTPCLLDTFARTVGSGWGAADTGQTWDVGFSPTSVSGGTGKLVSTGSQVSVSMTVLNQLAACDTTYPMEWLVKFKHSSSSVPTIWLFLSSSVQVVIGDLGGGGAYFDIEGGATTSGSFSWVGDQWYWMRAQVGDTYRRARIWADGTTEPSTWPANDPFTITPSALWVGVANFTAGTLEVGHYEWGGLTGDQGGAAGLSAQVAWDLAGYEATDWFQFGGSLPYAAQTVTVKCRFQDIAADDEDRCFIEFYLSGTGSISINGNYIIIKPATTSGSWPIYHNGGTDFDFGYAELSIAGIDLTDWFWLKTESALTTFRAKIWQDGAAEPGAWGAEASSPGNPEGINGTFFQGFTNNWSLGDAPPPTYSNLYGSWLWQFASYDITGYPSPTDLFDRTVVDAWGVSSSCTAWTTQFANPPTDAVIGVEGAGGAPCPFDEFDRDLGPYITPISDFSLGSARPGPWYSTYATTYTPGLVQIHDGYLEIRGSGGTGQFNAQVDLTDAPPLEPYEFTLAFSFDTIPSIPTSGGFPLNNENAVYLDVTSYNPGGGGPFFTRARVSSTYLGWAPYWDGYDSDHPWSPVANRIYYFKSRYDPMDGSLSNKLWSEVEAEPGWQEVNATGYAPAELPVNDITLAIQLQHGASGGPDDEDEYNRLIGWKIYWIHDQPTAEPGATGTSSIVMRGHGRLGDA